MTDGASWIAEVQQNFTGRELLGDAGLMAEFAIVNSTLLPALVECLLAFEWGYGVARGKLRRGDSMSIFTEFRSYPTIRGRLTFLWRRAQFEDRLGTLEHELYLARQKHRATGDVSPKTIGEYVDAWLEGAERG